MAEVYEKLIGAIVAILFGSVFILYCKKIGEVLVLSENMFWKNTALKTKINQTNVGYINFARYFILFLGILLVISGIIMFLQFLKGIRTIH